MKKIAGVLGLLLVAGVCVAGLRWDRTPQLPSEVPPRLSWPELAERPLFNALDDRYLSLTQRRSKFGRLTGIRPHSCRPDEINWAKTMDEAVERATAEDKLIFVITFCWQNGDNTCDV